MTKFDLMLPPGLSNPFSKPRDLDPDTAKMVEDMLGKEARKAFEALDEEPKRPREKPTEPTEQEKAAMRKAEKGLLERREQIKSWKTIRIGEHNTPEEMRKALEDGGFKIGDWAKQILEKTSFSGTPMDIEFVNLSVQELGFDDKATTQEIYDHAAELGLALCPAEAGPEFRLQYPDQPFGEWLYVAMEPIADSGDGLSVFNVGRGVDGRWLDTGDGSPGRVWSAGHRWVFLCSKQKK